MENRIEKLKRKYCIYCGRILDTDGVCPHQDEHVLQNGITVCIPKSNDDRTAKAILDEAFGKSRLSINTKPYPCPYCKHEVEALWKFCSYCGKELLGI